MPTVLLTPPSPPEIRTPQAPARPVQASASSKPSFSETLSEKRRVADADAIADATIASEPPDSARVTAGGPQEASAATRNERQGTTVSATDTAHSRRDVAQNLPNAGGATLLDSTVDFVGTSATSATTAESGPSGPAAEAAGSQPGTGPVPLNLSGSTAVDQVPVASPTDVPAQQVPAGESQSSAPRSGQVAAPPAVGGHVATDGQKQASGTGADGNSSGAHDESGTRHPAMGRAMQVQAAVTVENATGVTSPGGMNAAASLTGLADTGVPAPPAGAAGLDLVDAQATGRVVRGLTSMLAARGGTMTMRLEPPGLGQLRVQMTIVRGTVTAQFQPATAEAQALLERSLGALRTALESQGLTVERLTVHAAPPSPPARETADDQSNSQQQHASRHHADAGDGRSRGRGDDESGHDSPKHRLSASFADAIESFAGDSPGSLDDIPQGAEAA